MSQLTEEEKIIVCDRMQKDFDALSHSKGAYPLNDYIANHEASLTEEDNSPMAALIHELSLNSASDGFLSNEEIFKHALISYVWVNKVARARLESAIDDCKIDGDIS